MGLRAGIWASELDRDEGEEGEGGEISPNVNTYVIGSFGAAAPKRIRLVLIIQSIVWI